MDAFNILIWLFFSQVSYQGLDTENQRLQKALENSSKKIQQLEAELQEVESENQTLQRNLEELKISSKRLEQLEQEVGKKIIFLMHSFRRNDHMCHWKIIPWRIWWLSRCLEIGTIFGSKSCGWHCCRCITDTASVALLEWTNCVGRMGPIKLA